MNIKRIFGAVLTLLGIVGLIYAAVLFSYTTNSIRPPIIYSVVGLIFFIAGIGLISKTKDEA
jgi:protein-S-isoprenylcysteine O-methyltransferase Ste14